MALTLCKKQQMKKLLAFLKKSVFDKTSGVKKETTVYEPYADLNKYYKEYGLQIDEYGNPVYSTNDPSMI
jgi:hypothetical protein